MAYNPGLDSFIFFNTRSCCRYALYDAISANINISIFSLSISDQLPLTRYLLKCLEANEHYSLRDRPFFAELPQSSFKLASRPLDHSTTGQPIAS